MKRSKTLIKRWKSLRNGERPGTVMNGQERSNALERIVENGHGTVTFTHQKRNNYCKLHVRS
jgi:hypothetical protein